MFTDKQSRTCAKCGFKDSEKNLFRFPKPGARNALRCEAWARFTYPDKTWHDINLQKTLHFNHKVLCSKHFKPTSFTDVACTKLHRNAIPGLECEKIMMTNTNFARSLPAPVLLDPTLLGSSQSTKVNQDRYIQTSIQAKESGPTNYPCKYASAPEQVAVVNSMTKDGSKLPTGETEESQVPCKNKSDRDQRIDITLEAPNLKTKNCDKITKAAKTETANEKARRLMKKIWQLKKSLKQSKAVSSKAILKILADEKDIVKLQKVVSPAFAVVLQGQIRNFSKKPKGRRWTKDDKIIALRLYKRSPTCYKLLRRLFCLPAPSSLKQMLSHFEMKPGINLKVLNTLKKYIKNQKPSDNQFVLMFDEMNIKKHLQYNKKSDIIEGFQDHGEHGRTPQEAVKALVFMIAGIRKAVKQPLAYYLSGANVTADRLTVLIKEALHACFNAGLNVTATVCDMAATNHRALRSLGASQNDPVFNYGNKKVVTLFDVPHLIKCFRNMFLKYDIKCEIDVHSEGKCGEGLASWRDIQNFHQNESLNANFVYAPKLKKEHLEPNTKQKMRVNLAVQVLSNSVAGGMYAQISQGLLPTSALATAEVVLKMDNLFDLCNSSSPDLRNGKPFSTNISNASPHIKYFQEMKRFLANLRYQGAPRTPPSIEGWIWAINGMTALWQNTKKSFSDVKSLATRRLQQDALENLFGCIRSNCGSNANPTTSAFVGGLKTAILSNLAHVTSGNCEDDKNEAVISSFKTLLSTSEPASSSKTTVPKEIDPFLEMDYNFWTAEDLLEDDEDSAEIQACAYVCGFIIKNRESFLKCETCKKIIVACEPGYLHNFVINKEYNHLKQNLNYATKELVQCVENCATVTNNCLKKGAHRSHLKRYIYDQMRPDMFNFLKVCDGHYGTNVDYIKHSVFHICVKRHCTLKNRSFSAEGTRVALLRKMDILQNK